MVIFRRFSQIYIIYFIRVSDIDLKIIGVFILRWASLSISLKILSNILFAGRMVHESRRLLLISIEGHQITVVDISIFRFHLHIQVFRQQ